MKAGIRMLMVNLMHLMASSNSPHYKQSQARLMNKMSGGALFSASPIPQRGISQKKRRKLARGSKHPKLTTRMKFK